MVRYKTICPYHLVRRHKKGETASSITCINFKGKYERTVFIFIIKNIIEYKSARKQRVALFHKFPSYLLFEQCLPDSNHILEQYFAEQEVSIFSCGCYISQQHVTAFWSHSVTFQHGNVGSNVLPASMGLGILHVYRNEFCMRSAA